jgi:hypothetical protein
MWEIGVVETVRILPPGVVSLPRGSKSHIGSTHHLHQNMRNSTSQFFSTMEWEALFLMFRGKSEKQYVDPMWDLLPARAKTPPGERILTVSTTPISHIGSTGKVRGFLHHGVGGTISHVLVKMVCGSNVGFAPPRERNPPRREDPYGFDHANFPHEMYLISSYPNEE